MDLTHEGATWLDQELAGCTFADERLTKRLHKLLEQLEGAMGASLPLACQDWAATKAAYRFFTNGRVSEREILAGHFEATRNRLAAMKGLILILHDTTEFTYRRQQAAAIGVTSRVNSGKDKAGRWRMHTVCGLLMHSSLAVTIDGLPLGLAAIKFWSRKKFRGSAALKRRINPTRVPIEAKESVRWLENMRQSSALVADARRCIHIGDRESDIYELFCTADELGTHFLVRSCVDRLADDGEHTLVDVMKDVPIKARHRIVVRDAKGKPSTARLEIKYQSVQVLPPIGKQRRYPALTLTVICAHERAAPKDREKIDWQLVTDLPIGSAKEAVEKLDWYARRWKIELYHKILKSGCRAEDAKLRTAERLVNLLAVFCVLAWRVFWLTMLNRTAPDASPRLVLTNLEIRVLDQLVTRHHGQPRTKTLAHYLTKIARLGGYLARAHDPPPGNMVMWRGLSRLTDIELGATLGARLVGN
jgi:Transposase DNA-binding/Transposase Tn5 dimerisation domain